MYVGFHVKYPFFVSDCNETCTVLTDFRQIFKYKIKKKILLVWADLFLADGGTRGWMDWFVPCGRRDEGLDGQTDRHGEADSCFSKFFERHKKQPW